MIKPNELRIGNLFHKINRQSEVHIPEDGISFKIMAINFLTVDCVIDNQIPAQVETWQKIWIKDLSPIPLTEEWLLKLGFVKDDFVWCDGTVSTGVFVRHGVFIEFQVSGFTLSIITGTSACKRNTFIACGNYIHQLQNLYFDIRREELTIQS